MDRKTVIVDQGKNIDAPYELGLTYEKKTRDFTVTVFIDLINKRVKVEDYEAKDYDALSRYLEFLAAENSLSKIIMVARESDWKNFFVRNYLVEALHPTILMGEPGIHLAKFLTNERKTSMVWQQEEIVLQKALQVSLEVKPLPLGCEVRTAGLTDIDLMMPLYSSVFETYPSNLTDPAYLRKLISSGSALFKIIVLNEKVISAASIYIDKTTLSAELTDCATFPEYRGQGLISHLILLLEEEAKKQGLITLYSIARACSVGMNGAFHKHDFEYCGRFIKNCDICGKFEDMNLWSKKIG